MFLPSIIVKQWLFVFDTNEKIEFLVQSTLDYFHQFWANFGLNSFVKCVLTAWHEFMIYYKFSIKMNISFNHDQKTNRNNWASTLLIFYFSWYISTSVKNTLKSGPLYTYIKPKENLSWGIWKTTQFKRRINCHILNISVNNFHRICLHP